MRTARPPHWPLLLGEIAGYSFAALLATGAFLAVFYDPAAPYPSVVRLSLEVRGGLLVRQLHHWSAALFVLALAARLGWAFFAAAYRRPYLAAWTAGVAVLAAALAASFLGMALPGDRLGLSGAREAHGTITAIPVVGARLAYLLAGGEFPGAVVPRAFTAHVVLAALMAAPVLALRRSGASTTPAPARHRSGAVTTPIPARHRGKAVTVPVPARHRGGGVPVLPPRRGGAVTALWTVAVLAALAAFVTVNPVWEHGPYRPGAPPPSAQPFWYYGVPEGLMRLAPAWETTVAGGTLSVGVLLPPLLLGAFFAILFCFPLMERSLDRVALGWAVLTFFAVAWSATWFTTDLSATTPLPVAAGFYPVLLTILRIAALVLPAAVFVVARSRRRTPEGTPAH
ncbi:cytochrome b N-terminal domain-containing protein [Nonomuraea longicatena]|uniref:Cytochrome bc1 complex cytochrome b subunit n=1 Tax=Nonomuraea longicatena TaxID=83682 RepID=A0ABN1PKP8_9ACTN